MQRTFLRERLVPNVIGWHHVDNLHYGAPEFVAEAVKHHNHLRVSSFGPGTSRLSRKCRNTDTNVCATWHRHSCLCDSFKFLERGSAP